MLIRRRKNKESSGRLALLPATSIRVFQKEKEEKIWEKDEGNEEAFRSLTKRTRQWPDAEEEKEERNREENRWKNKKE